jgi:phosphomannomutase
VGALLADHLIAHGASGTFATSIVSTPGLARIASRFGFGYAETLTGFKWISRAPGLRYGFEEALGYLVDPSVLRDKDGISAAVAVLVEALALRAEGRTLLDRLAEVDVDRAVEIIAAGAEPLRDLVGAIHSKLLLAELQRQREER